MPHHDNGEELLRAFLRQRDQRRNDAYLARLQASVRRHGGECLSTVFNGNRAMYRFRCKVGHEWERTGSATLHNGKCPECVKVPSFTLEQLRQMASEHGGHCLAERLSTRPCKILWCCRLGHRWRASPKEIHNGRWCPECAAVALPLLLRSLRTPAALRRIQLNCIDDREEREFGER